MSKPYFNDAIIGNSHMLGCLNSEGEIIRLFWPNIDYIQNIERFLCGIHFAGTETNTRWFNHENWNCEQKYVEDTNIIQTIYSNADLGLRVEQTDYVLINKDVLIRSYNIENIGENEIEIDFVVYSSFTTSQENLRGSIFDFQNEMLLHYRHDNYIGIIGEREAKSFQLGNNAFEKASNADLYGYDDIGMMQDGAIVWDLNKIERGKKLNFNIAICASDSLGGLKRLASYCKSVDYNLEMRKTSEYWHKYLDNSRIITTCDQDINRLYKRSLLVFKLLADDMTGALLAAPEIDEDFTKCGRYAYCWTRDAAFITAALDKAGLSKEVDAFYKWAVSIQDENGAWHQRYHMDGNLGPSWGLQIDETGTVIWGMFKHYEVTGDKNFLSSVWDSVIKGVRFMIGFIDKDTGLPSPSFDLWEERSGEHLYSSAAVYAGIDAAVKIASALDIRSDEVQCWEEITYKIREAALKNFWKEDAGRFIRSVRVKLNPWGNEPTDDVVNIKVNNKGMSRYVTCEDYTIDTSMLGAAVPFELLCAQDEKMKKTVQVIECVLGTSPSGGIKRYENDNYIGGNPWIITTLWTALYYIKVEDYNKAKEYLKWSVKCRTYLDLLPEQVDRENGKPAWVIPLTWSHAMFVLVLLELLDAGVEL